MESFAGSRKGVRGAARLGYGRCPACGKPRRLFAALLTTAAPRGCRRCVAVLVLVATTLDRWRWLADRAQRAERARVAARAARDSFESAKLTTGEFNEP